MSTTKESTTYISNPFRLIFNGFSNLFTYNQTMAIVLLVFSVIGGFMQFGNSMPMNFGGSTTTTDPGSVDSVISGAVWAALAMVAFFIFIVVIPVAIFIGVMFSGMSAFASWKTAQKQTTTFEEAFKVTFKKFWTILWIQIVVFFKVLGGTLLFVIPGIRAALRYNMVLFPIFDGDHNASEAIKQSKALTKNHLIEVFGMTVAAGIIPFVGKIMQIGGQSIMYPQLKHLKATGNPKPPVHWLNYLGFILIAGLFLLIALFALVIAAFMAQN